MCATRAQAPGFGAQVGRKPNRDAAFLRSDIRKPNPAVPVPVLVDGGHVLTESRIINEYLEHAYAQPRLCPRAHAPVDQVRG